MVITPKASTSLFMNLCRLFAATPLRRSAWHALATTRRSAYGPPQLGIQRLRWAVAPPTPRRDWALVAWRAAARALHYAGKVRFNVRMMICLPPQSTPPLPNTAADMAHSTHSAANGSIRLIRLGTGCLASGRTRPSSRRGYMYMCIYIHVYIYIHIYIYIYI